MEGHSTPMSALISFRRAGLLLFVLLVPVGLASSMPAAPSQDGAEAQEAQHSLAYQWLLTPEERKVARQALEAEHHALAKQGLPSKWKATDHKRCLVVHYSSRQIAKAAKSLGEEIYDFLEDHFDYIGEGEYVRKPVIRIYVDSRDRLAVDPYKISNRRPEVRLSASSLRMTGYASVDLIDYWFFDRSIDMQAALPEWCKIGLKDLFSGAYISGSKITFVPNHYDHSALRLAFDSGSGVTTEELMRLDTPDAWRKFQKDNSHSMTKVARVHARYLMEYLLVGRGLTNKAHRSILPDYLKSLQTSLTRATAELNAEERAARKSAEDGAPEALDGMAEVLAIDDRRAKISKIAGQHLEYAFECTFRDWTAKDWANLQKGIERGL